MNHAEVKSKWIFAHGLNTEEEIRKNSQLSYHANKIIELFSLIISEIDKINPADFKDVLHLGKNHYSYGVRAQDFIVNFEFHQF
jgi:hypothetical protein